jgi:hypothetical protein
MPARATASESIAALFVLAVTSASACTPPPPVEPVDDAGACRARVRAFADGGLDRGACPIQGCEADNGMSLVVGTGRDGTTDGYRPLRDGDELYVIPGEQGLQHLLVGFRGAGFDGRLPLIEVRARRASDCVEVGYVRFRLTFEPDPADPSRLAIPGIRVVLDDNVDRREYCTILGRDVVLVIDATTPEGQWAHREVRVRVADIDPNTRPELREAWRNACLRVDGGTTDAAVRDAANVDVGAADGANVADTSGPDASDFDAR